MDHPLDELQDHHDYENDEQDSDDRADETAIHGFSFLGGDGDRLSPYAMTAA